MTNSPAATARPFQPFEPGMGSDPMTQLQRIFVYFLQNLFREFPEGCGLRWSPNEEMTELMITAEKPEVSAIEKLPHIVCILGKSQWGNISLDQHQHTTFSTGERKHTDLVSSTMAYHCMSKSGNFARVMAWNASFYTNVFHRIMCKIDGIHKVAQNHGISEESPASAYVGPLAVDELIGVVVTVPFFWQPQWIIRSLDTQVWRKLELTLKVNKAQSMYSAGRLNQVRPPRVRGRVVTSQPLVTEPPEVSFEQEVDEESYPT